MPPDVISVVTMQPRRVKYSYRVFEARSHRRTVPRLQALLKAGRAPISAVFAHTVVGDARVPRRCVWPFLL
jgi:hypothetical protein